jgi:actin-related protein 8
VGDECLLAPLALFHPELFALTITNGKKMRILNRNEGLSDDPFDENYLIQTKRKYGETNENSGQTNDLNTSDQGVNDIDDLDACEVTANDKEINSDQQLLGIDQAILQCIDQCDSDEVKRRMYSSILLVGGGLAFAGIEKWLQSRLSLQIPVQYRGQSVDIVVKPKDMDTKIVTWKGAAVMSLLDSAQEMWINSDEWLKIGSRVLREKSSFVF